MVVNLTKQGIKMNYFIITGYFITAEQYFNKNRKAYEEMKVFLSAFRLLSKVKRQGRDCIPLN